MSGNFGRFRASEKCSVCKDDEGTSGANTKEDEQNRGLCSRPETSKISGYRPTRGSYKRIHAVHD